MSVSAPSKKQYRMLVVDDHAIVRHGLGVLLADAPDLVVGAEASTVEEGLEGLRKGNIDIAVVDLILQDRSGLDLIRQCRTEGIETPILVMSMNDENTHAEKALRAGAQGYVMKEDADEVLVDALRTVLSGEQYLSDTARDRVLQRLAEPETREERPEEMPHEGLASLTVREKEIFTYMGQGLTTRKMAELLALSARTVEVHRAHIKKKLNCDTMAELLRLAVKWSSE